MKYGPNSTIMRISLYQKEFKCNIKSYILHFLNDFFENEQFQVWKIWLNLTFQCNYGTIVCYHMCMNHCGRSHGKQFDIKYGWPIKTP